MITNKEIRKQAEETALKEYTGEGVHAKVLWSQGASVYGISWLKEEGCCLGHIILMISMHIT